MRLAAGLAAALLLTVASAALAAPRPPEAVRAAVQAEIDGVLSAPEPDEPAWIRTPTAAMFRRVDINDDGIADWRIDYEKAPNPSYFCGTGGCRQQLWVSNASGGYDLVFNLTVRTFKLRRKDGAAVLDVDFHGSVCNGFGVDECPRSYGWAASDRRFIERASPAGGGFLIGGPTPPVRLAEAALPGPVRAAVEERAQTCREAGGDYPYADARVTDVTDLNGDGVRDWVVGGLYDGCAFEDTAPDNAPAFPVIVLLSRPGGFVRALEKQPMAWGLELTGRTATFVTLAGAGGDCGLNGADCEKTRWRWDGAALVSKTAKQP